MKVPWDRRRGLSNATRTAEPLAGRGSALPPSPSGDPEPFDDLFRRLVLMLAPPIDGEAMRSVVDRFLSESRTARWAAEAALVRALAARLEPLPASADEVDLDSLAAPERDALLRLTEELYAVHQLRFALAALPEPGHCVGDPEWHTHLLSSD